jgi:hypothetical protein
MIPLFVPVIAFVLTTTSTSGDSRASPASPAISITLGARHAHVTPERSGCGRTGGGNIDIQQPAPDTVVITMTGVAVACGLPFKVSSASMQFELDQCMEVSWDDRNVKNAKLIVEGRVIGLLRGGSKGGSAGFSAASVSICGAELGIEPHGVGGCDSQSINCREESMKIPVSAGPYRLRQTFAVSAAHSLGFGKAASAEFAPDPALDPLWISHWEPFHGVVKKDFGFQVIIKASLDNDASK